MARPPVRAVGGGFPFAQAGWTFRLHGSLRTALITIKTGRAVKDNELVEPTSQLQFISRLELSALYKPT